MSISTTSRSTFLLLVLAAAALMPVPGHAADVVVFGDSWAEGAADELASTFVARGRSDITVAGYGVGGTTAELWASQPNALPDAVALNPDARWVWLSIGGNDVFAHYAGGNGANAAADNSRNIRTMLDALFARHPDIKVVFFGYDFPNFEQSTTCIQLAWQYFGTSVTTPTVNRIFLDAIGAVQAGVAAGYPNVTYVPDVWGTLQKAGGVAGAPNPLFPSPSKYMADCIHANHSGYLLIHGALYDAYWGRPAPDAAIQGGGTACVGDSITLRDVSTGAVTRRWKVDGADAGDAVQIVVPLTQAGPRTISLRVDAGAWDDSASVTVTGQAAPSVSITGARDVVTGTLQAYQAIGSASSYSWSVEGGTLQSASGAHATVLWGEAGSGAVRLAAASAIGCQGQASLAVTIRAATCGDGLPVGTPCDDGDACTIDDRCTATACRGIARSCDDANACTDDTCDPATGCVFTPNDDPCDNGDPCSVARCAGGACVVTGLAPGCCDRDADCEAPFHACAVAERTCVPVLCAPCDGDGDCGPDGNACLALPSGGACGVDCSAPGVSCPVDFVCADLGDGIRQCMPVAGDCACVPEFARTCRGDEAVWVDSCGQSGEAIADCGSRGCVAGECCPEGTRVVEGECVSDPVPEQDIEPGIEPFAETASEAVVEPLPDLGEEAIPEGVEPAVEPTPDAGSPDLDTLPPGKDVPDAWMEDGTDPGGTGPGRAGGGCSLGGLSRPGAATVLLVFLGWMVVARRRLACRNAPPGALGRDAAP